METHIGKEQLVQLEQFINLCNTYPALLHKPALKFFKDYLESLGAKLPEFEDVPESDQKSTEKDSPKMDETASSDIEDEHPEESDEESEVELDTTGVIEPDIIEVTTPVELETVEVTDETLDECNRLRMEATDAINEGDFEKAIALFSEAIQKNPQSSVLYAKRAGVFLKQQKPNAAIRDCSQALILNPDQALAYKNRGYAHRLLGHWEDASRDLAIACNIDYSDEANEWLKEVTPNVKKLMEHKRKYERKQMEKLLKERRAKFQPMKEEKAPEENAPDFGSFMGEQPFQPTAETVKELLQDPEILQAFQDPEILTMYQDMSQNPANLIKHQANPKFKNLMELINKKHQGKNTSADFSAV